MDRILSILSVFSVIWSNILLFAISDNEYFKGYPGSPGCRRALILMYSIYLLTLFYNIFTIFFCRKVKKEKQTSKVPSVCSIAGTVMFTMIAIIFSFAVTVVAITGGV